MSRLEASAKAYRVTFPAAMHERELQRLQHWADHNCYKSAVTRTPAAVIWVAMRERTRTQGAFRRHVRDVLDTCAIACRPQGRWLTLLSNEDAESSIMGHTAQESQREPENDRAYAQDERVIALGSPVKPAFGSSRESTTQASPHAARGNPRARGPYTFETVRE